MSSSSTTDMKKQITTHIESELSSLVLEYMNTEPCDVCGLEHEIEEYKKYQTVYLPNLPQKYMDDLKRHYKQYETVNVCLKCVSKICFDCGRKGTNNMFNYHRHCEKCDTWICPTCGVWSMGRACCPEKLKF